MRDTVDHRKELRLAFSVLAVFWLVAGFCFLLGVSALAFIVLVVGTLAASERFLRIIQRGSTSSVRVLTAFAWLAVLAANFGFGIVLLVPNAVSLAGF